MKSILIATRGYARYRDDLLMSTGENLPEGWELIHTTPNRTEDLWEVDWDNLLARDRPLKHVHFPKLGPFAFIRGLEGLAPDIIIIQEYSAPMLKLLAYGLLHRIPVLACSDLGRESDWSQFPKIARLIHRFAGRFTSGIIAHTRSAEKPLSASFQKPIFVPHSIDMRSILGVSSKSASADTIRILMVGQYIPRKGHDLLAKAARKLLDRGVGNFEIRLVGTQDPQWVREVIEKEKVSAHFTLKGVLKGEDLFDQFRTADFFVLTSRYDTFAVVVHEAAAFGLPLIISKFAESSQLLVNEGKNGFVVDPHDTEELAGAMALLITDAGLRRKMAVESRKIAEDQCASRSGAKLAEWLTGRSG